MEDIQWIVAGADDPTEDLIRFDNRIAVVLDGATGIGDVSVTDAASDGRWYVEALADELFNRGATDRPLTAVVERAIESVADAYRESVDEAFPDRHEIPSAAGVVLRWDQTTVEYLILGDCTLLLETSSERKAVVGSGPRELDRQAVAQMQRLREESEEMDYDTVWERLQDTLVEHRRQKNQPGGYWTFGLDPRAVGRAETATVNRNQVQTLAAFTDGLDPISEAFDLFERRINLLRYLRDDGPSRAVRMLRTFERTDPECTEYPRLKPSDDVGVLVILP